MKRKVNLFKLGVFFIMKCYCGTSWCAFVITAGAVGARFRASGSLLPSGLAVLQSSLSPREAWHGGEEGRGSVWPHIVDISKCPCGPPLFLVYLGGEEL